MASMQPLLSLSSNLSHSPPSWLTEQALPSMPQPLTTAPASAQEPPRSKRLCAAHHASLFGCLKKYDCRHSTRASVFLQSLHDRQPGRCCTPPFSPHSALGGFSVCQMPSLLQGTASTHAAAAFLCRHRAITQQASHSKPQHIKLVKTHCYGQVGGARRAAQRARGGCAHAPACTSCAW